MDDAGEAIGALIGIALVIAAAVWLIGLILTGLGYLALAVGAVLGLVVAIIGFAPLIASAVVWFAAGAPKLFEANDIELLVGGVLATVQAIGFIVGLWLHDKRPEEEFHRFLSGWLVSGIFLGAVAAVAVMLVGGHQLNLITLQVALYSIYETFQGRPALRERLRQILVPRADSGIRVPPLYGLLAEVPVPLLILSTAFDTRIEQAFRAAGKPYDLVIYPADRKDLASAVLWWPHDETQPRTPAPNELDIDLATTTVIFKMHGSVRPESDEWDGFVITEDDHVECLSRVAAKSAIPSLFFAYFRDRSLLFVGCRLHDWNLRVAIRSLSRYFARRTTAEADEEILSWAVDEQISELEVKLWRRRGVYPFQIAIDEFVAKLRERAPK